MELMDRINQRAKEDKWHQICLEKLQEAEPAFLAIRDTLTEQQRDALDDYISACEELEHSKVHIACEMILEII